MKFVFGGGEPAHRARQHLLAAPDMPTGMNPAQGMGQCPNAAARNHDQVVTGGQP